jgi:hypothetical protein
VSERSISAFSAIRQRHKINFYEKTMDDNSGMSKEPDPSQSDPERVREDENQFERNAGEDRQAEMRAGVERMRNIVAQADALPAAEVQLAQMPPEGARVTNHQILVAVEHGNRQQAQQIQQLQQQVGQLQQQVQAAADGPSCAGILCKYVTIAMSIIGGIAAAPAAYYAVRTFFSGMLLASIREEASLVGVEGAPSAALDNPDIAEVAKIWLKNSEADFWNNMADFVDANKPRPFEEQLLFTQFTADIAVALRKPQWTWATPKDKLDQIAKLSESIQTDGLSAAYRSLPTISYEGKALPRVVAADLMSLALTEWWTNNG